MSIKRAGGRRILRAKAVMSRMGWSRTTLWRRVRAGEFPAPMQTGPNTIGWFDDLVDDAQEKLVAVDYAPPPEAA
jgi:prophage regulatory protein